MDKVLKRRLIGASIVIALAVIFVPMLLVDPDAVDDSGARDVEIPPMPDESREVRRIPLDPEAARVPEAGVQDRTGAQPDEAPQDPARSGQQPPESESETARGDEIVLRPEPRQEPVREPAPDPRDTSEPAPESGPDSGEVPATGEDRESVESDPDEASGTWVVQVASFGSRDSSDLVAGRLEALGHTVMRDELVRGQSMLFRLRTGPYPDRGAAERAREQIVATVNGVEPIVRRADDAADGREPGFAVQVGSFVSENNAESETARLGELGFDAFRFNEEVGGRPIWRVMVGPVATREEADRLKARLTEQAGVEGLVVSHP